MTSNFAFFNDIVPGDCLENNYLLVFVPNYINFIQNNSIEIILIDEKVITSFN